MPRILGQKKLRSADEDSFYNSITATELFARHANLAPILIKNLQREDSINPSLVPILSMLSRVAPGLLSEEDSNKDLKHHLVTFKLIFINLLSHTQYVVRNLAAKSVIGFTCQSDMVSTLTMLLKLWQANTNTNFCHGILMALYLGTNLLKKEYPRQYHEYRESIQTPLPSNLLHTCKKVPMNLLLLQKWTKILDLDQHLSFSHAINEDYHPGGKELMLQYGAAVSHLDHCKTFLNQLSKHSVREIFQFIEENALEKEVLTGPMMEDISSHICQMRDKEVLEDGELALELLNITTHPKIVKEKRFGKSASSSFVSLSALAFSAMISQDDFSMFFGQDGSTYVSLFCDTAEAAFLLAQPHHQEIERAYAADFILHLVPVFLTRIFSTDEPCHLSIHMHYGLVQVLNTGLLILSDEDNVIRMKAVDFASQLAQQKVCVTKAIHCLTLLGLQFFEESVEFFKPVLQLSHLQWTFVANQEERTESQSLFENGDGINVYSEEAFTTALYAQTLREWLGTLDRSPKFRILNCQVEELKGHVLEVKTMLLKEDSLFAAPWSDSKGYAQAVQIYYFLDMIHQFPILLEGRTNGLDNELINETCHLLASKLFIRRR